MSTIPNIQKADKFVCKLYPAYSIKYKELGTMDLNNIREDFPILSRTVYNRPLVYLDNGATTQKPRCVVDAITDEYYSVNANVHRGVHFLSQQATELHEASRETVRKFINARSTNEIVFTRGTTESINLLAYSFGEAMMKEGDEVIISTMEHHSNIVPWQLLAERKGIKLRVIPITDEGELVMEEYERLFNEKTRLVSVMHVSNVLGTVNPVRRIIDTAHSHGVPVLIDGAQSTPHFAVDMQELDCDFFAFSGHKIYGPTGVGVLYGKEEWLDRLPPYQGGGEMIKNVSFEKTTFRAIRIHQLNVSSDGESVKNPLPKLKPKNWLYHSTPAKAQKSRLLTQSSPFA